jgi:hypothetical protein
MIIGLCGKKRVGKDTVADYLVNKYGFVKYSFSQPIKEVAKIMFDFSDEQLYGDLKENEDPRWGISPRHFFQNFGTEYMQYIFPTHFPNSTKTIPNKCFWVKRFMIWYYKEKEKDPNIKVVIADVRFVHEFNSLKKINAYLIKIENDNISNLDTHCSENELNELKKEDYSYIIHNNKSVTELYSEIDKLIK